MAKRHCRGSRAAGRSPVFEIGTHGQVHAHLPDLDESAAAARDSQPVTLSVHHAVWPIRSTISSRPYSEYNEATVLLLAKA